MNILHILSQTQLTGAEVYATTLINEQVQTGHHVIQVSNQFFVPSRAHEQISLDVESKGLFNFLKAVSTLRQMLIDKKIQVIHSHSRAAAKLVFYARRGLTIGHISTVHGRQHVSVSKKLMNQYGEFIIPICVNIKRQLAEEFLYNPRYIKTLPNPVDHKKFEFKDLKRSEGIFKIAIIGRLTGPKKIRTELFIKHFSELLLAHDIQFEITVAGGIWPENSSIKNISHAQLDSNFLSQFDLICGSGRVAIESLLSGVPCIAFGEAQYIGLITEENFSYATESSFGDIGFNFDLPNFDLIQAEKDIHKLLKNNLDLKKIAKLAQDYFNLAYIHKKIIRLYESAYFLRNYSKWIPVLMYHKIPDSEINSPHKIYVTKSNFEKHLIFFKTNNMNAITFNELSLYRKGLKDWALFPKNPFVITFDDGYLDNITNADPLLKKYSMPAHLYLLADPNVSSNTWDNEKDHNDYHEIVSGTDRLKWKNTQFQIGSHGMSHQRLPEMSKTEKLAELTNSKKMLETEFSQPVISYAYTYGDTNLDCALAAESVGYEYAVNTDAGGLLLEESPYSIFRVNIFPDETIFSLWKKTRKWYRKYFYLKRGK